MTSARSAVAAAAFGAVASAVACLQVATQPCGDLVCPESHVCRQGACVAAELVRACEAPSPDGACASSQIPVGRCVDGVCVAVTCGDGVKLAPEQCEGADLGDATCGSLGFYQGDLACQDSCQFDVRGCAQFCGDGEVNGPELCDGSLPIESCLEFGFDAGIATCSSACGASFADCEQTDWVTRSALQGRRVIAVDDQRLLVETDLDGLLEVDVATGTTRPVPLAPGYAVEDFVVTSGEVFILANRLTQLGDWVLYRASRSGPIEWTHSAAPVFSFDLDVRGDQLFFAGLRLVARPLLGGPDVELTDAARYVATTLDAVWSHDGTTLTRWQEDGLGGWTASPVGALAAPGVMVGVQDTLYVTEFLGRPLVRTLRGGALQPRMPLDVEDACLAFSVSSSGEVALACGDELAVDAGGHFETVPGPSGTRSFAAFGASWVALGFGLAERMPSYWRRLSGGGPNAVARGDDDEIFVANSSETVRWSGDQATSIGPGGERLCSRPGFLAVADSSRTELCSPDPDLTPADPWRCDTYVPGTGETTLTGLACHPSGRVWVSTRPLPSEPTELVLIEGGVARAVLTAHIEDLAVLDPDRVAALMPSADGVSVVAIDTNGSQAPLFSATTLRTLWACPGGLYGGGVGQIVRWVDGITTTEQLAYGEPITAFAGADCDNVIAFGALRAYARTAAGSWRPIAAPFDAAARSAVIVGDDALVATGGSLFRIVR